LPANSGECSAAWLASPRTKARTVDATTQTRSTRQHMAHILRLDLLLSSVCSTSTAHSCGEIPQNRRFVEPPLGGALAPVTPGPTADVARRRFSGGAYRLQPSQMPPCKRLLLIARS
jgi:hypothetical protein